MRDQPLRKNIKNGFKLGFVGAGNIARRHLGAFRALADVEVVAVADPSAGARAGFIQEAGHAVREFANPVEMLEVVRPDAVVISSPPSQREEVFAAAVKLGTHVLMEKPLAHNAASARRLAEMAGKSKAVAVAGYCHRFVPGVRELRRRVAEGKWGRLLTLTSTFGGPMPQFATHWMSDPKASGGGSLIDTGCHSLDVVQFVAGPVARLHGSLRFSWPGRGEDSARLVGETASGALLHVTSSWLLPNGCAEVSLAFEKGEIAFAYGDVLRVRESGGEWSEEKLDADAGVRFPRQAAAFLERIDGKPTEAATFEEAARVNEWIEGVYRECGGV
ncbi:MAG: Gfo/Idh/MocA family protein [Verrucomicrobiia bacterium]